MRDSRPKLLVLLSEDTPALGNIQQKAVALLKLNQTVQAMLPVQLRPWCRVANYRRGILVLEVANGSWLMKLRYEQINLLQTLRTEKIPSLASIDIKINPMLMFNYTEKKQPTGNNEANQTPSLVKHQLSPNSAEYLNNLAQKSPKQLREKLQRLASLAGKPN